MASLGKSFTPTYHHEPYPAIDPTRAELSARNKVVVVTGGGQGIGKGVAHAFAKADSRAIIITGHTERTLLETKAELEQINKAVHVRTFVGDVTDGNGVRDIFASVKEEFGPIATEDPDDAWKGYEINVKGTFNVVRAFIGVASLHATLINVSSSIAHARIPGYQSYGSSKAAVLSWLEYVQRENERIRVVSVQPGVVDTSMKARSEVAAEDDVNLPAHFSVWLASPEAAFLSGKFVWANWDVDELTVKAKEIKEGRLLQMTLAGWERTY